MGTESSPSIWRPAPDQNVLSPSSGDVAATPISISLPAAIGKINYLTGLEITGGGATGASIIQVTLSGLAGGTKTYNLAVPAGAAVGISPLILEFPIPLPASGPGVAITLAVPSFGAGNLHAAANLQGFQQVG